jgi:hypothetical protein
MYKTKREASVSTMATQMRRRGIEAEVSPQLQVHFEDLLVREEEEKKRNV